MIVNKLWRCHWLEKRISKNAINKIGEIRSITTSYCYILFILPRSWFQFVFLEHMVREIVDIVRNKNELVQYIE